MVVRNGPSEMDRDFSDLILGMDGFSQNPFGDSTVSWSGWN